MIFCGNCNELVLHVNCGESRPDISSADKKIGVPGFVFRVTEVRPDERETETGQKHVDGNRQYVHTFSRGI